MGEKAKKKKLVVILNFKIVTSVDLLWPKIHYEILP